MKDYKRTLENISRMLREEIFFKNRRLKCLQLITPKICHIMIVCHQLVTCFIMTLILYTFRRPCGAWGGQRHSSGWLLPAISSFVYYPNVSTNIISYMFYDVKKMWESIGLRHRGQKVLIMPKVLLSIVIDY